MVPFSAAVGERPPSFLFKVVGLFRMGFNEYDTRLAYVSLADAQRLASARGSVFGGRAALLGPDDGARACQGGRAASGRPTAIIDWKELNHNLFMALTMQKVMISLLLVLIIVVAAFNIIASLTMIVLSKVREIAILKSMGARAATVARIFLVGGTTVGAIGTGLGHRLRPARLPAGARLRLPARSQGLSDRRAAGAHRARRDRRRRRRRRSVSASWRPSIPRCAPADYAPSTACAHTVSAALKLLRDAALI